MLLLHSLEIIVTIRRDDVADVKFRHFQPVRCQFRVDGVAQTAADSVEMLVQLQDGNVVALDDFRQIRLHLRHDERAEVPQPVLVKDFLLLQPRCRADDADEQPPRVADPQVKRARRPQFHMDARHRVKHADFARRAPLDAQLRRQVDEVDLRAEGRALRRQLVDAVHLGERGGFQRVAPRAEGIQRFAVAEEHGFLTFVHNQLRSRGKIRQRVLPHNRLIVALIADDRRNALRTHLCLLHLRLYVVHRTADGAVHLVHRAVRVQLAAAPMAAERHGFPHHQRRLAHRAAGIRAIRLIKNNLIAAGRALAAG